MKFLTEKRDIAAALNLGKYPVIFMEIHKPADGWQTGDGVYEGCKVRVRKGEYLDGTPHFTNCRAMIFVDNDHKGILDTVDNRLASDIWLQNGGSFLVDSYTSHDVVDMAENAMAPVVEEDQEVAVVYRWWEHRNGRESMMAAVRIMKVGRVDRMCSTVAKLLDVS